MEKIIGVMVFFLNRMLKITFKTTFRYELDPWTGNLKYDQQKRQNSFFQWWVIIALNDRLFSFLFYSNPRIEVL
ncbi:MAG: hypothetical protein MK066_03385 [Crocinitomicaceae bacterium]|nr:hypothetical protein [Crocinitomicaceae bacterium]